MVEAVDALLGLGIRVHMRLHIAPEATVINALLACWS
jgi:hypothetical protein